MDNVQLQPGIYTNIFPVTLPDPQATIMVIKRAKLPDLRSLEAEVAASNMDVFLYARRNLVFGYGADALTFLRERGFSELQVSLNNEPELSAHLVIKGILAAAFAKGFWQRKKSSSKDVTGRIEIFRPQPAGILTQGIKLFAGYDLRCTYYATIESLGLVVDVIWAYQDRNGKHLHPRQMREHNAMNEALFIQEELLRGTNRVNTQISQIRMHKYLLPFVQEFRVFSLPCGGQAQLEAVPFPVIL